MLVAQIYVDDIIFGVINQSLCEHFAKEMQSEFEINMMGELTFFLGLQVKQCKDGIFINQAKYIKDMLKKFGFEDVREIGTPMSPITKLDKDEKGKDVNQKLYKGMIGSLLYLTASKPDVSFVYAYVLDFKHALRNPTWLRLNESLDIFLVLKT